MAWLRKVLLGGELDPSMVASAERSGFVTIDEPLRQYSSFFLRLVIATVIATAGIAADSATTIIGAMLVAPLMSPMLGTALAAAIGRPRRTIATFGLTLVGMAVVFVVSIGVTAIIPVDVDLSTNSQVLARTSPRLVDRIIALAAGFMAALASLRRDIPDAVPGIAISASIVPPLCVVGAAFYEGVPGSALGALLLFITNYVAIQIAGAAVFLLAGLGTREFSVMEGKARETWYLAVALASVVVVLLLGASSMGVIHRNDQLRRVQDTVAAWVDGSDYRVSRLEFENDALRIEIAGSGRVPSAALLDDDLADAGVALDELSVAVVEEHRILHG